MEHIVLCEICNFNFNKERVIPKVLRCGHTFCLPCIKKLVEGKEKCPKCTTEIKEDIKNLPTNLSILLAAEDLNSTSCLFHLFRAIEGLENKFLKKKETLTEKGRLIALNLELIENSITQFKEFWIPGNEDANLKKAKEIYSRLLKIYNKIETNFPMKSWKAGVPVATSLKDFKTSREYLEEIYSRLQNEEAVYTVEKVDECLKYGKLSIENNMLLIHCLCVTELPPNSTLVLFSDFRKCTEAQDFFAFLRLSCNDKRVAHLVIIELFDSYLFLQFIKLCTGECGSTYKNCFYIKGEDFCYYYSVLKVEGYATNDVKALGSIDYCSNLKTNYNFLKNDVAVVGFQDGSFNLYELGQNGEITNAIGKVIKPLKLQDCISFRENSDLQILDSGFLFKL